MLRRVRIKTVPKARTGYQVRGALANDVPAFGGADYNAYIGEPDAKVKRTISAVPREEANLEAEGGETVVGNLDGSMMPSFKKIVGPRHTNGGVPLNLPDDSFIFSDTKSMMIKDPHILKMFNRPEKKGGYTPAELSKKFDINKYRQILQDPNSDKIDRKTAELMIKNCVLKLGALALAQESKKGFPQGIPEIAKPYMEANGIAEEDLIPKKHEEQGEMPQQEMGESQEMQGMEGQEEMPMQMPNGEPVAMPQQGMPQMGQPGMEQMQGAPMAMYGMQMGGYDMPFYSDPNEMAYGGTPKPISRPRPLPRADGGTQVGGGKKTKDNLTDEDKKIIANQWNNKTDDYIAYVNSKRGITNNPKLIDAMYEQYKKDIKDKGSYTKGKANDQLYKGFSGELEKMTKDQMVEQLLAQEERNARLNAYGFDPAKSTQRISQTNKGSRTNDEALALIKKTPGLQDLKFDSGYKGQAAYISYRNTLNKPEFKQHGQFQVGVGDETVGGVRGAITGIDNANTNTTLGQRLNYMEPPEPEGPCQCEDPAKPNYKPKDDKGNCTCEPVEEGPCQCEDATKSGYKPKDKDGNCTCNPPEDKCECKDPETGEIYDPGKDTAGNCNECTKDVPGEIPPKKDPEWWLQDTVNTAGAFGDLMSAKKYMPWEARADLEEPRPVFLDPTRELAAQSEQANIASQAAASFAGPQALNSRLSQIQGTGAANAADTLSKINNQNVNIANQFEGQQVGIRNQEQMMNQQMAGRVYDKNTVANQQFDNAKRQGRANMRESYNTALTNRAKTDAMNQMYPNYQVDPSSGGMVNYTPTEKKADPGTKDADVFEYRNQLKAAGWSEKEITAEMARKFGKKYGGAIYGDGGGVYVMGGSIYPFTF
jgi:hypothetical protein